MDDGDSKVCVVVCTDEHGWCDVRIVWMIGIVRCAWVCVHDPVIDKGRKGMSAMKRFWEVFGQCLKSFESERRILVLGNMNAKVVNREIGGLNGVNENGQYLVDVCAERNLFLEKHLLPAQTNSQIYMGKGRHE